ncbi:3-methylornithine--L-lysine ligase PylC [Parasporobacterium paucivorans]|uniref:Pyrrolysine biosynthesis protein PylC n=1 Tax=Parasporobacterium paucivorans DSM 15970 TaxID=1122934 RepID=A0A1M6IHP5_9FIRM|nr:3-methylornithine--L-lysine ligase PylC [Parasporobacterium paucivorans]SHJ33971.1 pyrrolysine biosynthesis protein PylC [Parasporobacterium paucivorans DSM 15970]
MNILIIGAKLQGVEAMYLAGKAGYHVVAVDHNAQAPGAGLADEFVVADVHEEDRMLPMFLKADVVLPVIEDYDVLAKVEEYGIRTGTKVIFDLTAYGISSSKEKSNNLFVENHLPVPGTYPECDYPVILKPDGESGSLHVKKADFPWEAEEYLKAHTDKSTVIQEYLEGRILSLEVVGDGENFCFPLITEVVVDGGHDCKRIIAPAEVDAEEERQMLEIGRKLADILKIKGIFDIEAISHKGKMKLLEIDARLPSQTPISIYHSTGMNLVEMMTDLALGRADEVKILPAQKVCLLQQIQVRGGEIQVMGEKMMGSCSHLRIYKDFFGCTEAVTDYEEGSRDWKGIIIVTGKSRELAMEKFHSFIRNMKEKTGLANWRLAEG